MTTNNFLVNLNFPMKPNIFFKKIKRLQKENGKEPSNK